VIVLSLFDGISGGQLALKRAGIKVEKYYASEIDPYAIKTTQKNFPETIQLGDITKIKGKDLSKIDLIIGGSPCQGFSFAGKQLNFEDPRSALFFEFVRLVNECNPRYFLLENVKMKKEHQDVITKYLGVEPILINSRLVSAQNRERLYWINIPNLHQPKDKEIFLKDVVFEDALFLGAMRGRYLIDGKRQDHKIKTAGLTTQQFEIRTDGKTNTITTVQKDNVILTKEGFAVCMHNLYGGFKEKEHRTFLEKAPIIRTAAGGGHIPSLLLSEKAQEYMNREVKDGRTHWDFKHHSDVRNPKSATVVANFFKGVPYNVLKDWNCIRYFDPVEVERLQTYPDNYTEGISKTQRYKALGNSFTVDVIAHILRGMK
jgi:DNA-cytosine methyltransferase